MRWIAVLLLLAAATPAAGKPAALFGWGAETLHIVVDLPETPTNRMGGVPVDIAVVYKEVSLFWLPLWQYDFRWVLASTSARQIFAVERPMIEPLAQAHGVVLPDRPDLGFWREWGGKLVLAAILLLPVLMGALRGRRPPPDAGRSGRRRGTAP